ncbi:AAA family ATPase, partial [bacterium]
MMNLTPRQIVEKLDADIVGQQDAKRAVAVAVRNRWRRQQLAEDVARDVYPKNILMQGPTGVGKTEIARRLAKLVDAPFVKVEATKFTEVGYQGRDVEGMIRDLLETSIGMVQQELSKTVAAQAEQAAEERILDLLLPRPYGQSTEENESYERTRDRFRQQLRDGELEEQTVELSIEHKPDVGSMFGSAGMELTPDLMGMFERVMPTRREGKRMPIRQARKVLAGQEGEKIVDKDKLIELAIAKCENNG